MKTPGTRAAADGCSGTPAVAGARARVQPHGRAAHHPRRRGQHDRRLCVRVPAVRPEVPRRPRSRSIRTRSRASVRTSTTSTTTCSTRFTSPPGTTWRRAARRYAYQFQFDTTFRNRNTILQSYLGVVGNVGDASQNLVQRYTVTKVDDRTGELDTVSDAGIVPPNNQGNATPKYNQGDDGEQPAKDGVATEAELDPYTSQSIAELDERLPRVCRPARRRVLRRHPGGLRPAEAARARTRRSTRRAGSTSTRSR